MMTRVLPFCHFHDGLDPPPPHCPPTVSLRPLSLPFYNSQSGKHLYTTSRATTTPLLPVPPSDRHHSASALPGFVHLCTDVLAAVARCAEGPAGICVTLQFKHFTVCPGLHGEPLSGHKTSVKRLWHNLSKDLLPSGIWALPLFLDYI